MKGVLIIFSHPRERRSSTNYGGFAEILNKDAKKYGYEAEYTSLVDLEFKIINQKASIYDPKNRKDIKDYDLVFFRMWSKEFERATAAAIYLKKNGTKLLDSEPYSHRVLSKLTGYFLMWEVGIPIPDTFLGSHESIIEEASKSKDWHFPLILKSIDTKKGRDNYLVKNLGELKKVLSLNKDIDFVMQNFIPNDFDYRFLVTGKKVAAVIKRSRAPGTHLNNTSTGAVGEQVAVKSFPQRVVRDAILSVQTHKRELAGVDVIVDKETGQHYILEVNKVPQIVTGALVEKKVKAFHHFVEAKLSSNSKGKKQKIGPHIVVNFPEFGLENVEAKIDTGADRGALHCTTIKLINQGSNKYLSFIPLDPAYSLYSGKPVRVRNFKTTMVKNTSGHAQRRYVVKTKMSFGHKTYPIDLTLSDRTKMRTPVLIGRKFLRGRYVVDVGAELS